MERYDLIVIGAGSGNSVITPDFDDWRIALVEEGPIGGTCLNRGCIPSKMFVYTADLAAAAAAGERYGLHTRFDRADWRAIRDRIFDRIDPIATAGLDYRLELDHVDVFPTRAGFVDHKVLQVGDETILGETVVLAAGAHAVIPDIPGLSDVPFHTSDTIMRIDDLPDRLLVIGGGYIAVEMGHVFSAFDCDVTVVARNDRLLASEDSEISARATAAYDRLLDLRLGTVVTSVIRDGDEIVLRTGSGEIRGDMLLVATGRHPNGASLRVDRTGVRMDADGYVVTDAHCRTNVDGIWAIGDIASPVQLKHKANADARIVAHNIAHPDDLHSLDLGPIPHAVFGRPQIASVGPTEAEVEAAGVPHVCVVQPYGHAAYGWAMEDETSVAKLIAHAETRRLLAAHIIGPQASTLIQQLIQGMRFGQTVDEMAREQWYIHPSLSEVVEQALLEL